MSTFYRKSSQALWKKFFTYAPVPFLLLSEELAVEDLNLSAQSLFNIPSNWSRGEMLGCVLCCVNIDPETGRNIDSSRCRSCLLRKNSIKAFAEGVDINRTQGYFTQKSGTRERELFLQISVGELPGISPKRLLLCIEDLTAQNAMENRLRENETRYRELVETTNAISWEYDPVKDQWSYVGPQAENILGYSPDEWKSLEWWRSRVHPDDREWAGDFCRITVSNGEDHAFSYRFIAKDGRVVWLYDSVSIVRAERRIVKLRGFMLDITDQKRREAFIQAHLELNDFARRHSTEELFRKSLDILESLTGSRISCFHFLNEDEKHLLAPVCSSAFLAAHHDLKINHTAFTPVSPGLWKKCIDQKSPAYCNETSYRSGETVPVGHPLFNRELVVPVFSGDRPSAVMVLADKPVNYDASDLEIASSLSGLVWDIAEHRKTGARLLDEQKRYKVLFEKMMNGFALHEIILNRRGKPVDYRFLEINPAFSQITGLERDIVGKTVLEVLPRIESFYINTYGKVALQGESINFESYSRELDKFFEVTAFSPRKNYFATIIADITPRKLLEEASRERDAHFRTMADSAMEGIVFSRAGIIIGANKRFMEMVKDSNPIGKKILKYVNESWHKHFRQLIRLHDGEPSEVTFICGKRKCFWAKVSVKDVIYLGEKVKVFALLNVHAEHTAKIELEKANCELQALTARLHRIREEEKLKLSRHLHDELAQLLTAAKIGLNRLEKNMSRRVGNEESVCKELVADIRESIDEAVESARTLSREIRPSIIDDLGLFEAIEWQIDKFRKRSGIAVSFKKPALPSRIPKESAVGIFRIFQEALTNIARHANADEVSVRISNTARKFTLEVADNGIGIPEISLNSAESTGIIDMMERARQLGGEVVIKGKPGKGTKVVFSIYK